MKIVFAAVAGVTTVLAFTAGTVTGGYPPSRGAPAMHVPPSVRRPIPAAELSAVVKEYCSGCHNSFTLKGNFSLDGYDVAAPQEHLAVSEKMIRKLRSGIMPPPGEKRPGGDTLLTLVETIEQNIDKASRPNPGTRTFQRLNRPEYERAVKDLLGIEMVAGDYLPLDTKSANFDNIADVQALSPTLLEAYLNAAAAVSRMAVGDIKAPPTLANFTTSLFASQHPWNHVDGAPYGTRGGIVVTYDFPADAKYTFRLNVAGGVGTRLEDLVISVDGEQVALLHYERNIDRSLSSADFPQGADFVRSDSIKIPAGEHQVAAAFIRRGEGPYEDLIKPNDWSGASSGNGSAGSTEPPHLLELAIGGPYNATGVSDSPSRRLVFSCHPTVAAKQRACADEILTRLGSKAYRRPLTVRDKTSLLAFYDKGAALGGFEEGVRTALQAILASPYFVFRFEATPAKVTPGQDYAISDYDLASRLSFFLWGSLPDQELLTLAQQHKLSDSKTLEREVHRMLADPRSFALSTRFAAQWLRLQDLDKVHPDAVLFPDYDQQLADAMRTETELFFNDIVRNDRSVMDLYTANYTFVNERLAKHYGIPNISGSDFQRVTYLDDTRRGLLGQGSILVQTSLGNRTSPVLRGKWVMEVLIGMPPPPPPPNVPDLEETKDAKDGKPLTTRERMEIHRKNAVCHACHQYMDPIGLALDNFDVTGRWRYRENGMLLDTRGTMYDGSAITTPSDLSNALLKRPLPLVRAFTENLMAYAVGRRMEDFDQPTVRAIARDAEAKGYHLSAFVMGVVNSPAFRYKRADPVADMHDRQQ